MKRTHIRRDELSSQLRLPVDKALNNESQYILEYIWVILSKEEFFCCC